MLTIFGSINIDQVIRVPSIPAPGETTLGERVTDTYGGKGANQAVAAARASAGNVPVTMVGAVGRDRHGQGALANLHANGIHAECVEFDDCATGTAIITVSDDGENAITVVPGANARLKAEHVSAETLGQTATLLCQGEIPLSETLRVMAAFRASNADGTIVMNLAPVPNGNDLGSLRDVLRLCDILILNEHEAQAISQLLANPLCDRGQDIAAAFELCLIVTRGADGAELFPPRGESLHVASPSVVPLDTTGAGDTFCGVFAVLLTEGQAIEAAMRNACKAAAIACCVIGAQDGMPCRDAFLEGSELK